MTLNIIEETFEIIKAFWPPHVDISDGELFGEDGFRSWNLVRCEEHARSRIPADGTLLESSIWPFHIALWEASRDKFRMGETVVQIDDAAMATFEHYLQEQVKDASGLILRDELE